MHADSPSCVQTDADGKTLRVCVPRPHGHAAEHRGGRSSSHLLVQGAGGSWRANVRADCWLSGRAAIGAVEFVSISVSYIPNAEYM